MIGEVDLRLKNWRLRLAQVVAFGLVVFVFARPWILKDTGELRHPKRVQLSEASFPDEFDAHIFKKKTKVVLGALKYFEEQQGHRAGARELINTLETKLFDGPAVEGAEPVTAYQRVLLARYRNNQMVEEELWAEISELQYKTPTALRIESLLQSDQQLSEVDWTFLRAELDWLALLLEPSRRPDIASSQQALHDFVEAAFMKFTVIVTVVLFVGLMGFLSLAAFTFFASFGGIRRRFEVRKGYADFALEIFALYMIGMVALPFLASMFGNSENILLFNALGILALGVVILWPVFFKVPFKSVRETLGLRLGSFRRCLADILLSPFIYLGAITVLFLVLIIYAAIIQTMGVDISQGAHPIVPVLLSSQSDSKLFLVFFLAVFVAPLIEEIMFRGALYAWLRSRGGVVFSMLTSAVIFAVVHPQGVIGIVPLTMIGLLLAWVREWRGTLVAPMVTHACFNAGTLLGVLLFFR